MRGATGQLQLAIDAAGPPILMPILSLQDVSKDYLTDGQPVHALSALSLNIERASLWRWWGGAAAENPRCSILRAMDFPTSARCFWDEFRRPP